MIPELQEGQVEDKVSQLNRENYQHFCRFLGKPQRVLAFPEVSEIASRDISVAEFPPASPEFGWRYQTISMADHVVSSEFPLRRMELLMYSDVYSDEIAGNLAAVAAYPFVHKVVIDVGHTIAGSGSGFVEGSPLTEVLLTPVYFEDEGYNTIVNSGGISTVVLCVTPIYLSERQFAVAHGWKTLLRDYFEPQEVLVGDLFRFRSV